MSNLLVFVCIYFLIVLAEIFMGVDKYIGIFFHSVVILAVLSYLTYVRNNNSCRVVTPLILLPILRFVNVSAPIFFPYTIYWLPLVYFPLFLSVYAVVRALDMGVEDIGFKFEKIYLYAPLGIVIGFIFAIIEFKILEPSNLIPVLGISGVLTLIIVMFIFVALAEELIFRSVLQTSFERYFGSIRGILLATGLFAIMHIRYGVLEFLFTFFAGFVIGYIFYKTRSLPFIVTIRGTIDFMIFGGFHIIGLRI